MFDPGGPEVERGPAGLHLVESALGPATRGACEANRGIRKIRVLEAGSAEPRKSRRFFYQEVVVLSSFG